MCAGQKDTSESLASDLGMGEGKRSGCRRGRSWGSGQAPHGFRVGSHVELMQRAAWVSPS